MYSSESGRGEGGPRGGRGRGRRRGGGGRRGGSEWFLHDDRSDDRWDRSNEASRTPGLHVEVRKTGERIVTPDRPVKPEVDSIRIQVGRSSSDRMVYLAGEPKRTSVEQTLWLYVDPEGLEHGPFPSERMIKWERKGFFNGSIGVCKFGTQNWTTLDAVRMEMMQSIEHSAVEHGGRQQRNQHCGTVPAAPSRGDVENATPDRISETAENARRGRSVFDRLQPVKDDAAGSARDSQTRVVEVPRGRPASGREQYRTQNPRDSGTPVPAPDAALTSVPDAPPPTEPPSEPIAVTGVRGGARDLDPRLSKKPEPSRGIRGGARELDPRYNPDPDPPRQKEKGGRKASGRDKGRNRKGGGRGKGGGGGRGFNPAPQLQKLSNSLFESGATLGSEVPMWRYIDLQGITQGPFPAKDMQVWFVNGYLHADLLVCGTERLVSPPNLPDKSMYRPLKVLMDEVASGNKYKPISPNDIQAKKKEIAAAALAAAPSEASATPADGNLNGAQSPKKVPDSAEVAVTADSSTVQRESSSQPEENVNKETGSEPVEAQSTSTDNVEPEGATG